jgi:2-oxoglutarate ferredoxin oxidoreductase subunit gamma
MLNGLNVCWIPSYGAEMRGGTANCSVIVSDEEMHSPVIEYTDSGIVLNQPSYEKFMPRIKKGGVLVPIAQ